MMKTALIWLLVGAFAGTVVTLITRPSVVGTAGDEAVIGLASDSSPVELDEGARLASRVASLEAQLGRLTEELQDLATEMAGLRTAMALDQNRAPGSSETRAMADSILTLRAAPPRQSPNANSLVERLVAGGFTRERAEWIKQRTDEMTMAAIRARDASVRDNTDPDAASFRIVTLGPGPALRAEMGDTEYEQYLRALGRDPVVDIDDVLANSPASLAGLQAGDQIVSYGGTRVFEFTEATPLTTQGRQGESVVVEILRDGQPMQIVVPRGPLGVRLSSGDSIAIGVVQPQ